MSETSCTIDGVGPIPIFVPESVGNVGDPVRQAGSCGEAVYPLGGRTHLDFGNPPRRRGLAADLRGLNQVNDYPARDMTVTVQAGITISRLQEFLSAEKQRLPIDIPMPERATVGGSVATNTSGPRRYAYGTLRDYVIGIRMVNAEGQEVKAGGKVVKNVAGYDLCKLYVGSLGTLGIVTEVTLKLKPQPEDQAIILIGCESAQLETVLEAIHVSCTRPVCVDLLNRSEDSSIGRLDHRPQGSWVVVVGFEDNSEAIDWQVKQLLSELQELKSGMPEPIRGEACKPVWKFMTEFQARPDARMTFKANFLPHATAAFCTRAESFPERPLLQAHAGNGIVFGHFGPELTLDRARTVLEELLSAAETAKGNVVVLRCPPDWKRDLPVWGRPRRDAWLMRRVKTRLDPNNIFNPGRFVDAI